MSRLRTAEELAQIRFIFKHPGLAADEDAVEEALFDLFDHVDALTAERDAAITVIRAQIAYDDAPIFPDWTALNAAWAALREWREANDA